MNNLQSQMAVEAKQRLPLLWSEICAIVDAVHPIELLCQLAFEQTHPTDTFPDVEQNARWQVRIELVAWHLLFSYRKKDFEEIFIGGDILEALEQKLEEYFLVYSSSIIESPGVSKEEDVRKRLSFTMRQEAINVRGEGTPSQIKSLCLGVYGPHNTWFQNNLGFTIGEAFLITETIVELLESNLETRRDQALSEGKTAKEKYKSVVSSRPEALSAEDTDLREYLLDTGIDEAARQAAIHACFYRFRDVFAIDEQKVVDLLGEDCSPDAVRSYFARMSQHLGSATEPPTPLGMNPLVKWPLIKFEGRYFLPCLPIMYDSLLSTFHYQILQDSRYRSQYDEVRGRWLETEALIQFLKIFPQKCIFWSLTYGSKGSQAELDGLIWFDNKLIFIEGKWKGITLAARMGDVDSIVADLDKSVVATFEQATRARDYLLNADQPVKFTDHAGTVVEINAAEIAQTFIVSLLGRGGLAVLTANLTKFAPKEMFANNEFPWALSLLDLSLVCDLLEGPSQLFHYLRWRTAFIADDRVMVHDEWDILGIYLDDALDLRDPQYFGVDTISCFGSDMKIDHYLRSIANDKLPKVSKPSRNIPAGIRKLVFEIENSDQIGRTDFCIALLSLSERALAETWDYIEQCVRKTKQDHKKHSVLLQYDETVFAFVCTYAEPTAIHEYCYLRKYRSKCSTCLGVGLDLNRADFPHEFVYIDGVWQFDEEDERLSRQFLGN